MDLFLGGNWTSVQDSQRFLAVAIGVELFDLALDDFVFALAILDSHWPDWFVAALLAGFGNAGEVAVVSQH